MAIKRRARSSDTDRPFPVKTTNAEAFKVAIWDLPSKRMRAGLSVMTLASRSDLKVVLFKLSKNKTGLASISSAAMRFSTSSVFAPAVTACGSRPNAMMQMQRARRPFPVPAPDRGGARNKIPGARSRLGRHTAVIKAARKEDSSMPGGFCMSTRAGSDPNPADRFCVCKTEGRENAADKRECCRRVITGGPLWNEPSKLRRTFNPHF